MSDQDDTREEDRAARAVDRKHDVTARAIDRSADTDARAVDRGHDVTARAEDRVRDRLANAQSLEAHWNRAIRDLNAYYRRLVWAMILFALTLTAVTAIGWLLLHKQDGEIALTRQIALRDACRVDTVQEDVMRAIINASLGQRRRLEREGVTPADGRTYEEARESAERLMAPLGGLVQTPEEKAERCKERVQRGTPPP